MRAAVSELADRGRSATGDLLARLPSVPTIVTEIRRRMNLLELATKYDIELQSRLGRDRVSYVLKEFLDDQREHDEALRASLRSELREELQSFAAATSDGVFSLVESAVARPSPRTRTRIDDMYDDDDDDDDDFEDDLDDDVDKIDLVDRS